MCVDYIKALISLMEKSSAFQILRSETAHMSLISCGRKENVRKSHLQNETICSISKKNLGKSHMEIKHTQHLKRPEQVKTCEHFTSVFFFYYFYKPVRLKVLRFFILQQSGQIFLVSC